MQTGRVAAALIGLRPALAVEKNRRMLLLRHCLVATVQIHAV